MRWRAMRRSGSEWHDLLHQIDRPVLFLSVLLLGGTLGYRAIEGWTYLDSLYMTVITLTTVGFGETHPLSEGGRIFTIILLIGGVIFYATALNALAQGLLDHRFAEMMNQLGINRKIARMKDHYIICGGGRMAFAIGLELEKAGIPFIFIEQNPHSIVTEHKVRWPILIKDALLEESLLEAGIQKAKGLAAVLPTDADNLFVVLSARSLNPSLFIHTRIALESSRSKMIQAGANKVVSPYNAGGVQIARAFLNPEVDDFLSVVTDRAHYDFEMKMHTVSPDDPFCNKPLRQTEFRQEGFTVIAVKYPDGQMVFAPDASFSLRAGYQIFLMGPGRQIVRDEVE
ncbi:MAG: potassium channel protein [Leptonema illini]|nr:MAG: potassium channel protein [Leptonema illini]